MNREEARELLVNISAYDVDNKNIVKQEAMELAIEALEQEPCEDCISRQAAEDAIAETIVYGESLGYALANEILRDLPPVTPQPKMGRWEYVQYDSNPNIGNWHCSECRTIIPHMPEETDNTPIYKWCPMCGARMEVKRMTE